MSVINQPTKSTKITQYTLTKRMNEALVKECQKAESQKKTEQRILYLLSFCDKKKVKEFKRNYINFIVRYTPKTKHEEILKMCCQVKQNFRDLEHALMNLTHIPRQKRNKPNVLDETVKNKINKDIQFALNKHQNTFNILRDYIGKYKGVNRGRWASDDIILKNLKNMEENFISGETNKIITAANRCLNVWVKLYQLYVGYCYYYEENRKKQYNKRLRNKAIIRGKRFEKLILKGLFTSLVSPITDNNGYEEMGKETLNYMYEHVKGIYEEKYKDIKEIVNKLISPSSSSTDYEIIYSVYLKNI